MSKLVAIAGFARRAPGDPFAAEQALSHIARRLCSDRRSARDQVLTFEQQVLFDGRFGIATVFDGVSTPNDVHADVVVDATGAAAAIGEVWSAGAISTALRQHPHRPDRLNGEYAAVMYDDSSRTLLMYADRLGLQPLYYHVDASCCFFSSTVQSLLEHPGVPRKLSDAALGQLLYLGFLAGDETYVDGVNRLPGGTVLTCNQRGLSLRRYWSFEYRDDSPARPIDEYAEECYGLLRESAKRMTPEPDASGVLLSGGLDSRVTLGALVHEFGPRPVTCTYGLTETSDTRTAREVAAALKCRHHVIRLQCHALVADLLNSQIASDFLMESRNAQVPEVMRRTRPLASQWFSGFLLDATFGGYWLTEEPDAASPHSVPELLLARGPQEEIFQNVVGSDFVRHSQEAVVDAYQRSSAGFAPTTTENAYERYMIAYRHRGFHVASHAQFWPGERRFLMCDYDLFDFFLRLPVTMRRGKRLYIHMLKAKWPELSHVRYGNTGALVGEAASGTYLARKKRSRTIRKLARRLGMGRLLGPSPYVTADKAFTFAEHADVRRLVESILLSERALSRPYVQPAGVKQLVAAFKESGSSIRLLFRLLRLELLIRSSVEGDGGVFAEWGVEWHANRPGVQRGAPLPVPSSS